MPTLSVQIIRFVDDHFPGFVECEFVDANGQPHRFVEKAPVVTEMPLSAETAYPQSGMVACVIETQWEDDAGRTLRDICTERPWSITSQEGATRFTVMRAQVKADA